MNNRLGLPMPYGWFVVAYGDEIAKGESRPLHYFGRDLVIFRSEGGKVSVLDAYCPHLGAHLGYGIHGTSGGGRVEGESIVCPFHAWKFNGDGEVTDIPYAKAIPPRVRDGQCLPSHPTIEMNQCIYVWYHPDGVAPMWQPEHFPEADSDGWAPFNRFEWTINTTCQEMAENGFDGAHFRYVHQTASMPDATIEFTGHQSQSINRADLETPRGTVKGSITSKSIGPGQGFTRFEGIANTLLFGQVTPFDDETVHVRFAFTQPRQDGKVVEGGVNAAIVADICKQITEDIPIWEHKIYRPQPALCDGDGPISKFRKWYSQFYANQAAQAAQP